MGIEFLNKVRGMLENLFVGFSKRTSFWDISKWNRSTIIWDGRSINCFIHRTITFVPQFLSQL